MKKKATSVLGIAAVTVGLVTACGTSNTTNNTSATTTASNQKVTLTFWGGGQEEAPFMKTAIKSFEASHPNITVNWVMMGQEWTQKYPLALQSKNPPNIMWMTEAGFLAQAAQDGTIVDMDSEINQLNMKSRFSPSSWGFSTVNGKIYGLPFQMNTRLIAYNQTMLQKAGLQPPKTYAELLADAKKLNGNGKYGIVLGAKDGWPLLDTWSGIAGMEGSNVFAMQNGKFNFTSPQSVSALGYLAQLYKAGVFMPGTLSMTWDQANQAFENGQAAFMLDEGSWEVGDIATTAPNFKYDVIPWPAQTGNATGKLYGGAAVALMVPTNAQNQQQTFEFLNYITSVDPQKEYVKSTQEISPVPAANTPQTMTDPHLVTFAALLKNAQPYPAIANENETRSVLYQYLSEALAGQMSPQAALQAATQQANAQLNG
jgi:ABC-type glycerol-3-phosphate transport system substrate-binding protein